MLIPLTAQGPQFDWGIMQISVAVLLALALLTLGVELARHIPHRRSGRRGRAR
jgi:hypothetical protein